MLLAFEDSSHFNTFSCKYFVVVVVVEIKFNMETIIHLLKY